MALPNALNIYNFPDAYDSLVDAFTGTIKYISASTGSNSNTGNSVGAAYLTIDYALAQNTSATATMFVILEGTYTLTPTSVNGSSVGLTDGGNHREFVCAPGKVIIQHTASGADRDSAIFNMGNINSKIYGAIIKRNNNGRTTNYTVAYFRFNSAKGNFYNCVFSETNANNAWSYQYDNYGYNNLALRNCTFYHLAAPSGNYTNAGTCLTIDSVFNTTVTTGGTETNVLKSQTVNDTTYVTTGVTTAGVYSGTYAWNGSTTFDPGFGPPTPTTVVSGSTINLVYYHTSSSATVAYTITGVTSQDINGNSLSGNMTVTNSSATLSIPTTQFSSGGSKTLTITAGAYSASVSITPRLFIRSANGGTKSLVTRGGILYTVHRFNSSANFTISNADAGATADILIVAGGGSGGNHNTTNANGGGGAGGVLQGTATLAAGTYAVVVGAGGTAIANATALNGVKGTDSRLGSYIAEGGGGGGSSGVAFSSAAQNGGSGGGNALNQSGGGVANANATAGSLSVLGFNGGSTSTSYTGAGGGGAGAAGVNGSGSSPGGNGGIGITNTWTGSTLYLAGGGGGGGNSSERAGDGFYGGGRGAGTTTYYNYATYTNEINATTKGSGIPTAVVNSGGGGGGGSYWAPNGGWSTGSGAGGSGIVIVSYEATAGFAAPASVISGTTISIDYIHTASSGTVAYTISGVTSQDINGNPLSGNMTVTNSTATLSIPTASKINTTNTLTITAGALTASVTITPGISARYLVVAGGGGAGSNMGGGGGAGGYLAGTGLSISGSNNIVIGAGGAGAIAGTDSPAGSNGQNTTALGLTAIGGGGGASAHATSGSPAGNGGSGGGGSGGRQSSSSYGGLPGTGTAGQGNNGAASGVTWYPGGGGGAGAAASQTGSQQANGGIGLVNDILGTSYYWAGGGAGAGYTIYGGNGGLGGGGGGAPREGAGTTNGTGGGSALNSGSVAEIGTTGSQTNKRGGAAGVNTGGGGGGGSHYSVTNEGGAGGSGIVVIRYAGGQRASGGTVTTVSGDTVHTFLTSSTFTVFSGGLSSSHTSAYWAETVTLTYADDLADGSTIAYTITGVTSEQIGGASLTGNFTISSSLATLAINLATRTTNTSATMVITAGAYSRTITVSNLVSFFSSVAGTYWGGSITLTARAKGLTSGGLVPYTISGVTSAQISNASLTGDITVSPIQPVYSYLFTNTLSSRLAITMPPNYAINSLTTSWTLECWIYPSWTPDANYRGIFDFSGNNSGIRWGIYSNYLAVLNGGQGIGINLDAQNAVIVQNTWQHIALVSTPAAGNGSAILKQYYNGILIDTETGITASPGNMNQTTVTVGSFGAAGYFNGNISSLRLVRGTAVYTQDFIPSRLPLTAITNTTILTGQSATITEIANNCPITNTGPVTVSSLHQSQAGENIINYNTLAAQGISSGSLTVTTNPSEPILNSATMVTAITGGSITNQIRTGSPAVFQTYKPSLVSLDYIDTEITDIHSEALEARVSSLVDIGSRVNPVQFSTTVTNIEYIDTEITDIHSEALEAKVSSVSDLNAKLHVIKSDTSIAGFVAAPTFAYSSGEDVKVSPSATQTWYI